MTKTDSVIVFHAKKYNFEMKLKNQVHHPFNNQNYMPGISTQNNPPLEPSR